MNNQSQQISLEQVYNQDHMGHIVNNSIGRSLQFLNESKLIKSDKKSTISSSENQPKDNSITLSKNERKIEKKNDSSFESNGGNTSVENELDNTKTKSFLCSLKKTQSDINKDIIGFVRKFGREGSQINKEKALVLDNIKQTNKTHQLFKPLIKPKKKTKTNNSSVTLTAIKIEKHCESELIPIFEFKQKSSADTRSKSAPLNHFDNLINLDTLLSLVEENFSFSKKHFSSNNLFLLGKEKSSGELNTDNPEESEGDSESKQNELVRIINQRNEKLDKELANCYSKYFLDIIHNERKNNLKYV